MDYEVHDPSALGLDPVRLRTLVERAHREVDSGTVPSCQLAIGRNGKLALFETLGAAAPGSRYVMFSCTKGFIAGAVWLLAGEGKLSFDQMVVELIPEFGTNGKEVITIEQLLTHTSGFPWAPMNNDTASRRDSRLERFAQWRLNWEPGTRFEYHPTSAHWVLAEIIERVSGTDYRRFVEDRITRPLGLSAFQLGPAVGEQDDVNDLVLTGVLPTPEDIEAVMGYKLDLAELLGEVTDEALLQFNRPEVRSIGVPGAGGVATAADLALYCQGVLHDPVGLWPPEHVQWAAEVRADFPDPLRGNPAHRSLGLMVAGDPPDAQLRGFGYGVSPHTFGHDGAAGQIAWADPDSGVSFGYLTNGRDREIIREAKRTIGLSSRAAACLVE
ncbi:MAG: beta-lactamase family protein [Actinobacteria bacterium]|nr:beta-lactamase family protein [Actinomycetota bacterium]